MPGNTHTRHELPGCRRAQAAQIRDRKARSDRLRNAVRAAMEAASPAAKEVAKSAIWSDAVSDDEVPPLLLLLCVTAPITSPSVGCCSWRKWMASSRGPLCIRLMQNDNRQMHVLQRVRRILLTRKMRPPHVSAVSSAPATPALSGYCMLVHKVPCW